MASRPRDLVVVGASAGGVEALSAMAARLPADLPASVLVVLHLPAGGASSLPAILDRAGPLPACSARDGEPLAPSRIYVAPPDHHLLVVDDSVALSNGPTENGHRPAINALFRSAAVAAGPAVIGVLLSGALDDGVAGLVAIADRGGQVVVQHPTDAIYPSMAEHALRTLTPDHVVRAGDIGGVLGKLTQETVDDVAGDVAGAENAPPSMLRWENEVAGWRQGGPDVVGAKHLGAPSEFSCPDCHGVLADIDSGQRFRCRVGHAWTAEALLAAQGSALDRALWTALRTLEEKIALSARMARHARERGSDRSAERYDRSAEETREAAEVLRRLIGVAPADEDRASP